MADNLYISNFDMKKFFIKLFCLILLLVAFDFAGGMFFSFIHQQAFERSPYGLLTEYAMEDVHTDVLVVGASRANHHYVSSVIEDSLGLSVYNAGKDGCGFLYQCCIIDGILHRYTPKIIIWDMTPYDLSRPLQSDFDQLSDLNVYYDSNEYCRNLINQKSTYEKYKMFFHSYRYNSKVFSYIFKSIFSYNYPPDGYQPLPTDGYIFPTLKPEKINDDFDDKQLSHLAFIIDECRRKQVILIISLSPKFVKSDYWQAYVYKKLLEELQTRHIPYTDFYNDSLFMTDSTLYKDNDHLNDKGAQLFTKRWLEKYQIIIK